VRSCPVGPGILLEIPLGDGIPTSWGSLNTRHNGLRTA